MIILDESVESQESQESLMESGKHDSSEYCKWKAKEVFIKCANIKYDYTLDRGALNRIDASNEDFKTNATINSKTSAICSNTI